MKSLKVILSFVLLLALTACTEPSAGTTLKVQGTIPGSQAAASLGAGARAVASIDIPVEYPAGTAVGTISLTGAQIMVKEFELEQSGATSDGSFDFNGPYLVDLIAQTISPDPGTVDLPQGTYDQIKFKIDKVEGDEQDGSGNALAVPGDPIYGHSIYLEGTYTPTGGSPAAFQYSFDTDAEFELKPAGDTSVGFDINSLGADVIVAFRLHKWFTGIDPAAFAANPASFAEALKENIKLSADFGEDQDGDGNLSSSEDDDPDTEDQEDS